MTGLDVVLLAAISVGVVVCVAAVPLCICIEIALRRHDVGVAQAKKQELLAAEMSCSEREAESESGP